MTNNQFRKVARPEVDRIIAHGVFQKCQLSLDVNDKQRVVKIKLAIVPGDTIKRVYVLPQEIEELNDKACAFSFKVGTQMYFFKSKMKFSNRGFYVDAPKDQVYELARRKHIRFEAHPKFPIYCSAVVTNDSKAKITGELLNISFTGASLRVSGDGTLFNKKHSVHILLKPLQAAAFSVEANVRFVKKKPNNEAEIGLEFTPLDRMQMNRVNSICEALSFYVFTR